MRVARTISLLALALLAVLGSAQAQSPIATISLTPDQIGVIKTAPGITTRVAFPDTVTEIVCGDLYDPASGKGTFVVQRSGTDAFIKPVASKGVSNIFVKVGDGKLTFNFDLKVVPTAEAHRIVNVVDGSVADPARARNDAAEKALKDEAAELEKKRGEVERDARNRADDIIRNARQQAERITTESQAKVTEIERQATERGDRESQRRFIQALLVGLREVKVNDVRSTSRRVIISLNSRMLTLEDKAYLRYSIQNTGDQEFIFDAISLEVESAEGLEVVPSEIVQTKTENRLAPGESLAGVVVFESKRVTPRDKLTLYVRREDKAELLHVDVQ